METCGCYNWVTTFGTKCFPLELNKRFNVLMWILFQSKYVINAANSHSAKISPNHFFATQKKSPIVWVPHSLKLEVQCFVYKASQIVGGAHIQ